ncbi:hypothetical protein [Ensifer sp. ENS08]|uniref:hypothetical protein n=1 Tax=Ensifer sp. ENS08 TaxID=2769273 RepID=UPI00177F882A|nr:hypothetical protein [Ensifer sp. ENS08]MBD9573531.1 hypothetical protein [Ensifer sp. ENS08]
MSTEMIKDDERQLLVLEPIIASGQLDTSVVPINKFNIGVRSSESRLIRYLGLVILVPVLCSILYNFVIASDRYLSSASFLTRKMQAGGDVTSLLQGGGLVRTDDSSYAIVEYVKSRDLLKAIDGDGFVSASFADPSVDMFSRFPGRFTGFTKEDFYAHFQRFVNIHYDSTTGINEIAFQSFTPETAKEITRRILLASEALINNLNQRAYIDVEKFAKQAVDKNILTLEAAQKELTAFRNAEGFVDAKAEVGLSNKVLAGVLSELSAVETELSRLQLATPNSPLIVDLRLKRSALQEEVAKQRRLMTGDRTAISGKLERYERLVLERDLAEKTLINSVATLAKAQQDTSKERRYIDQVAEPTEADRPMLPYRWLNVIATLGISLALYWVTRSVLMLLMEAN